MSIEAAVTVTLAEVEVTDEFQIGLATHRKRITLAWDEALQLADELVEAVESAKRMVREDQASRPVVTHGFDVDPVEAAWGVLTAGVGSTPIGGELRRDSVNRDSAADDSGHVSGGAR